MPDKRNYFNRDRKLCIRTLKRNKQMRARKRKAQIWYTDFMVAVLIFVIALVIYYEFITNLSVKEQVILDELIADGKSISSSLVSGGSPHNWTNETVTRIGITDGNHKINQTKIDVLYNMSYNDAHRVFGTRFNFYIYFENSTNDRINITAGDTLGTIPSSYKHLMKITRLLVYESDIIKMQVNVWW